MKNGLWSLRPAVEYSIWHLGRLGRLTTTPPLSANSAAMQITAAGRSKNGHPSNVRPGKAQSDQVSARRTEHRDPEEQVPAPAVACGPFEHGTGEAVFSTSDHEQEMLRRRRLAQQLARWKAHLLAALTGEATKKLDGGVERLRTATKKAHVVSHIGDLLQERLVGTLGRVLDRATRRRERQIAPDADPPSCGGPGPSAGSSGVGSGWRRR